ncbi:hypothetical protein [Polaribacter litorisediminis]|nr:hypothetical protein [Polaribacter litorisediminis]
MFGAKVNTKPKEGSIWIGISKERDYLKNKNRSVGTSGAHERWVL